MYGFADRLLTLLCQGLGTLEVLVLMLLMVGELCPWYKEQLIFPEIDYDKVEKYKAWTLCLLQQQKLMRKVVSY